MSHTWVSHVTHISEVWVTRECIMSHIWLSYVAHMRGWCDVSIFKYLTSLAIKERREHTQRCVTLIHSNVWDDSFCISNMWHDVSIFKYLTWLMREYIDIEDVTWEWVTLMWLTVWHDSFKSHIDATLEWVNMTLMWHSQSCDSEHIHSENILALTLSRWNESMWHCLSRWNESMSHWCDS